MQRRHVLKLISTGLASCIAALVGLPGVRFLLAPLTHTVTNGPQTHRLATLDQLLAGQPVQFPVYGARRDGWTRYPREVVGRVWLVRRTALETPPAEARIDAFTAECPHLGCIVDYHSQSASFLCPCHRAAFTLDGQKIGSQELGYDNPAPRNMDQLQCRVVHDTADDRWWIEVEFTRFAYGISEQRPA